MIADPLALAAAIALGAALALGLEARARWAARVGAAVLAIALGALLSNTGLVPAESPIYDGIFGPVTSLAIVWLLLAVSLDDLRAAGPVMVGAFALAVAGTVCGALAATLILAGAFGDEAWKLAGVLTGTYSGGSLNFVAVGRALELPSSLFSATAAADNVVTAAWLGASLLLPVWIGRFYRPASDPIAGAEAAPADPAPALAHPVLSGERPGVSDIAILLGLGLSVLVSAGALHGVVPVVPEIVWVTTIALALGRVAPVRRLAGAMQLGYLALHLFFVLIGIGSRLAEIAAVGPEVLLLAGGTVLVHGIVLYGGGLLAGLDAGTLSVASQAAVGGPSTALAVAVGRGWGHLALPGIAVGLLGYAAGNYVGLAVAYLARALLGG